MKIEINNDELEIKIEWMIKTDKALKRGQLLRKVRHSNEKLENCPEMVGILDFGSGVNTSHNHPAVIPLQWIFVSGLVTFLV